MRRRYRYHAAKRFGSINKYLPMLYDGKGNILSRTDAGQFGYNAALPYALSELSSPAGGIPMRDQHISYNAMQQPDTIVENGYTATFNNDGEINIADVNALLEYILSN